MNRKLPAVRAFTDIQEHRCILFTMAKYNLPIVKRLDAAAIYVDVGRGGYGRGGGEDRKGCPGWDQQ